jgi:serine-type D-Ala-D-Ala carboxypeptidase/endopeptidase (penicillin-binding protein 4)
VRFFPPWRRDRGDFRLRFTKYIMKYLSIFFFTTALFSCKLTGQITQKQIDVFLNDTAVSSGHAGISIYEPATKQYWYNYNAEKNFTPSSNTKLFTMYAGMKYLGDSLVGVRYTEFPNNIVITPTGDPTLLHPDFLSQPIIYFLKATKKQINIRDENFKSTSYGNGWVWNDYQDYYMAERSPLPVYGNCLASVCKKNNYATTPSNVSDFIIHSEKNNESTMVGRDFFKNEFSIKLDDRSSQIITTPFITSLKLATNLLSDTIHKNINIGFPTLPDSVSYNWKKGLVYSRPTDSLLRPMMHNSDNFFAEQTLLMVSNERLGYMSDEDIIDTLLNTDFKDLPTKPRWVDGCGLSRYNLFSPKDFIYLLNKMKDEFGIERIKRILTTGGQGTLKGYYENAAGFIFAKTGSMSNNVSLSGYIYTKKSKMLIFSVHINGYSGTGRAGRRAIEKMLQKIRENN